MKPSLRILLGFALCFLARPGFAAASDWIALLHSPDVAVRRAAVDRIQTMDDARIPEACLPLLTDEGLSIRRQAARAIGSRFYQIPAERRPAFTAALRAYARDAPDGYGENAQVVAQRAIGLLTRDFSSPAFCLSPDKKWVLYEQRRRPMIADTDLTKLQLLAPKVPTGDPAGDYWTDTRAEDGEVVRESGPGRRLLKLMSTGCATEDLFGPHWQPESLGLEFQPIIQMRFFQPACLWRRRDGAYRVFAVDSFQPLYGKRFPHWSTILEFKKWEGTKAVFKIYDCDAAGGPPFDPTGILVSVDIETWRIALIPPAG